MDDRELFLMLLVGVVVALAMIIPMTIYDWKRSKANKERAFALCDAPAAAPCEDTTLHAEVVNMACGVETVGYQNYKQPKAVERYVVSFKRDDGGVFDVRVPEDMYECFEVGLSGTLTLVGGRVESFTPDDGAQKAEEAEE